MVAPVVAGALISGGISLLGGIFGGKSQRRAERRQNEAQRQADERNIKAAQEASELARKNQLEDAALMYERTRDSAERGGFNPLTAVLTGGANSQIVGGGSSFVPVSGGQHAPLASIGMITQGLKDIGSVWSGEAAQAQKRYDLEMDLAKIQLDNVKAQMQTARTISAIAKTTPSLGSQTKLSPMQPEYVPHEIQVGQDGQPADGTAGQMTVYGTRGQQLTFPYVEAEIDGFLMGLGAQAGMRLKRSSTWQHLKAAIPVIGDGGFSKFTDFILNPEEAALPQSGLVNTRVFFPSLYSKSGPGVRRVK